jgi:hypothetical protein
MIYLKNLTLTLLFIVLSFNSCSLFKPKTDNVKDKEEKQGSLNTTIKNDALEVYWRVPDIEVDGFVLSYGTKPDQLTERVRIEKDELRTLQDPTWGNVYRYVLLNIPKNEVVYFTLESFKGDQYSPPSSVQRVESL